ncbi:MAG: HD domain-containing phosphohydrolase [Pseudomonadota bacterium]
MRIMNKKQIPVGELRLGMYVTELDRPWLGTPFPFQGFPITSADQIAALKQHCKTVVIDLDRDATDGPHAGHGLTETSLLGSVVYTEAASVEKELPVARAIYSDFEENVQRTFDKLRVTEKLDLKSLKDSVRSMSRSIERNPDAMMLLSRIKQKSDAEFGRAVDTMIHMIAFGRFLQFPGERLLLLGFAGLLLNIGKVRLPDAVLQKKGALIAEEIALAKSHVMHSVDLIRAAPGLPQDLEDIVIQHHERLDGSGYPQGLRDKQISVDGAIAGLVDSYSAFTSVRPYAEQMSPSVALNTLHRLRETLFDEMLVEKFIECIGIYPVGSTVELNTGEVGIVIAQNLARRLKPRVMVILDAGLKPIRPQVILDLVKEPKATPDEPYRIMRTLPRDKLPIDLEQFLF